MKIQMQSKIMYILKFVKASDIIEAAFDDITRF